MALEMGGVCEKCGAGLSPEGLAYICSHECTFCAACADGLKGTCPNCGGELVRRPARRAARAASPSEGGAVVEAAAASCSLGT